jgi:hypothetical protein
MKNSILILILISVLSFNLSAKEVPSSGEMMFDVMPIRPLGVVSFLVGTTIFVAALPFSVLSANPEQVIRQNAKRLVVYPFRFTFQRPIGEFYGYMEEIEFVTE